MTTQCDRCKRETNGWPLKRADVCSPKHWARCIRQPRNVAKAKPPAKRRKPLTLPDIGIPEVTDLVIACGRARAECFSGGCLRLAEGGERCKIECRRVELLRAAAN